LDDLIFSKGDKDNHQDDQVVTKRAIEELKPVVVFLLISLSVMLIVRGSLVHRHGRKNIEHYALAQEQEGLSQVAPENVIAQQKPFAKELREREPLHRVITVKNNDNLGRIFRRLGLDDKEARKILALQKAAPLKQLRVDNKLTVEIEQSSNSLKKLDYEVNRLTNLIVTAGKNGVVHVDLKKIKPQIQVKYASSRVDKSIYASAKKIGISSRMVKQFMDLFDGKVDAKKITGQDRFSIFYREYLVDGKSVQDSEIVAAELTHRGVTHRLIAFKEKENGVAEFYTPDGKNGKPAFLRYPLAFSKISSKFSPSRKHPVLKIPRPHWGTDFAARVGTPVKAASNGRVTFAGYKNGYGRTIDIKHGEYMTRYAHLFKLVVTAGKYVSKGDLIGHVGSSGLSTAPHLHYEFHVRGTPVDPLKVSLPAGGVIAKQHRHKFFAISKNIVTQFDAHQRAGRSFAMHNHISFE
jgi:murein DD-endopeptidase MepM/ murein hydrolase activator NlpD